MTVLRLPSGGLWLFGGADDRTFRFNDVWTSSPNATSWTLMTRAFVVPAQTVQGVVTSQNYMLLMQDHVWGAPDGVHWLEHTSAAPWGRRSGQNVAVISNDTVLVIAGYNATDDKVVFNDVWQSTDHYVKPHPSPSAPHHDKKLSWELGVISAGASFLLFVVGVVVCYFRRRKRRFSHTFDLLEDGTVMLSVGSILLDRFELEKRLGEGGEGTVWRASPLDLGPLPAPVAVKVVALGPCT